MMYEIAGMIVATVAVWYVLYKAALWLLTPPKDADDDR